MMVGRWKRILFIISLIVFVFMGIMGCSRKEETVKLGVAGAHSGDLASYGIPTIHAAELVVKAINEKGGILGKKVELLVEDDACKPELATNAATKLVSEGVNVVLGHICSGATKAALKIYLDSKIIVMSPSATNTDLTLSGEYPNFFRTIAYDDAQAQLQVRYATQTLGAKKVAVLHDKGDYGKGQAELVKKYFEQAGVNVALFEGVTPGAVDYSAIVQKVERANVDLVTWGGYHPEATKIVTLMRKENMDTLFMGADGIKDEPSLGLAPLFVKQIFNILRQINTENNTPIFLVEQNANMALKVAHRGYVMENGRIRLADTARNLLENEDVRKAYLGL